MKKFLLYLFIIFSINANSQAVRKKNFQIDFGTGIGIYHAYDNLWGQLTNQGANAGAYLYHANVSYALVDQFSLGAELEVQSFMTNNGDTTRLTEEGNGASWLIRSDYHFLKKDNFTVFAGLGIGGAGIDYSRTEIDSLNNITTGSVHGEGTRISPRTGMKFFFGKKKHFGLFLDYSFNAYTYHITDFVLNGILQEYMSYRRSEDVILTVRGHEVRVGLTIKF